VSFASWYEQLSAEQQKIAQATKPPSNLPGIILYKSFALFGQRAYQTEAIDESMFSSHNNENRMNFSSNFRYAL
jgi:hypothetical protein